MTIIIGKVKEEHGCWGNMFPLPVSHKEKIYRTTEALFQVLRFSDEKIQEEIKNEKSPMGAKFVAKKYKEFMTILPMSKDDIENMKICLCLKLEQHSYLKNELIKTGDELIVEDCTRRKRGSGLFWGAAFENNTWIGQNWLGKLWMEIRNQIREQ